MSEELGKIIVEVVQKSSEAQGVSGPAPAPAPAPTPPPPPPPPVVPEVPKESIPQGSDISAALANFLPSMAGKVPGLGAAVGAAEGLAGAVGGAAGGLAAVAGPVGIVVAAAAVLSKVLSDLKDAIVATVKVMWSWHGKMLDMAREIGGFSSEVVGAMANERIASVNRRLEAGRVAGPFAADAVVRETGLRDALSALDNALAPIKAAVSGVLVSLAEIAVRILAELVNLLTSFLRAINGASRAIIEGIVRAVAMLLPIGGAQAADALLASIDMKLGAIQRNTKPKNFGRANAWAVNEIRAMGGRNW